MHLLYINTSNFNLLRMFNEYDYININNNTVDIYKYTHTHSQFSVRLNKSSQQQLNQGKTSDFTIRDFIGLDEQSLHCFSLVVHVRTLLKRLKGVSKDQTTLKTLDIIQRRGNCEISQCPVTALPFKNSASPRLTPGTRRCDTVTRPSLIPRRF